MFWELGGWSFLIAWGLLKSCCCETFLLMLRQLLLRVVAECFGSGDVGFGVVF